MMNWLGNLYVWLRDELPWVFTTLCLRCWHEKSQHISEAGVAECAGENFNGTACHAEQPSTPRSHPDHSQQLEEWAKEFLAAVKKHGCSEVADALAIVAHELMCRAYNLASGQIGGRTLTGLWELNICGHQNIFLYVIPGAPDALRCAMCDSKTVRSGEAPRSAAGATLEEHCRACGSAFRNQPCKIMAIDGSTKDCGHPWHAVEPISL